MSTVIVPIRIRSVMNLREGHWAKARRTAKHRRDTYLALRAALRIRPEMPVVVTLTRIAPQILDDDNSVSGLKACRDGVADFLGLNDRDPRITWHYGQDKGKPFEYLVRITVMPA